MANQGVNRVILLGVLGADPELRDAGGTSVLNIRMATTETYLDRNNNKQEKTEWHRVQVWGKRAEGLSKILVKGSRIYVEGSLQTRTWDKDGEKRYTTEINAQNVVLAGGKGKDGSFAANEEAAAEAVGVSNSDVPF